MHRYNASSLPNKLYSSKVSLFLAGPFATLRHLLHFEAILLFQRYLPFFAVAISHVLRSFALHDRFERQPISVLLDILETHRLW